MPKIAYVNGQYLPQDKAVVHVEDRGYQFADGVYEVIAVRQGQLIDAEAHFDRLGRSLLALRISYPVAPKALPMIVRQVVKKNRITNGQVYFQITRGVAPRNHAFPTQPTPPSLVITAKKGGSPSQALRDAGVKVITTPDIRWGRCDIKSVSLLPNVLAKQDAVEQGAFEAFQVKADGMVSEGSSSNAWMIGQDGVVLTHPATPEILNGITRQMLLKLAPGIGVTIREEAFTLEQLKTAAEAFMTSSSALVMPVVRVDDTEIGAGRPGPITQKLAQAYQDHMDRQC